MTPFVADNGAAVPIIRVIGYSCQCGRKADTKPTRERPALCAACWMREERE